MEGAERNGQVAGVDPQAGQRAARLEHAQGAFKGGLQSQRLDRGIDATAAGQFEDFLDHVDFAEVQGDVGAQTTGDFQPAVNAIYRDDGAGAAQSGSCGGAQADRALGEHHHYVANLDVGRLGPGKAGGHDVRAHQHLFVAQAVRYGGQVGLGVGNQYVLGLGTVDAVAKTPSTHGFVAVAAAAAVLRGQAVLAGIGGEAGADGAGDDPLAFLVALYVAPELLDDADRFMTDRQAAGHRVLTLEDVYIGAADGGG